jgi:hypothetical protein
MSEIQCLDPGCREDLISRIGACLTKKSAWIICMVLLLPILAVGVRVWGQSEFYAFEQVKASAVSIKHLEERATKLEVDYKHVCDTLVEMKEQQKTDTGSILEAISKLDK